MLSITAGMTDIYHHAQLFSIEREFSEIFLPGLTWNCSPPNFGLPYLGMTASCHHTQLLVEMRL
jgi:hypothetical protein